METSCSCNKISKTFDVKRKPSFSNGNRSCQCFQKLFNKQTKLLNELAGTLKNTDWSEEIRFIYKQLLNTEISLTLFGIKVYSVACTFPKIFWYLNFDENVPMTVATRLFWHFVTAAASLPANPTHSDVTKQAKTLHPLSQHVSIWLLPAELLEQRTSRGRGTHLHSRATPAPQPMGI